MSANRIQFTELAISRLSKPGIHYDAVVRAFGIRIGKTSKTFFVIKDGGRRTTIGRYPRIDLKSARRKAQQILLEEPAAAPSNTFTDALTIYRTTHMTTMRDKTRIEQDRIISTYWKPLHARQLASITRSDIAVILDTLVDKRKRWLRTTGAGFAFRLTGGGSGGDAARRWWRPVPG